MAFRKLAQTHGPTLAVLAALGAVAYLGHRTDWKIPRLTELRLGAAAAVEKEDGCEEHGVPESQCTICHPEIAAKSVEPRREPSEPTAAADPEAPPAKDSSTCQTHAVRIQFASADAVRKAGVRLEAVEKRPIADSIRANGEIEYDQRRVARLSARLPGFVARVEKGLGDRVTRGELVALIDSPEVGRAKSELLGALAHLDFADKTARRVRLSAESGTRSQAELLEAEAALRESRIRLFNAEQVLSNLGFRLPKLDGLSDGELVAAIHHLGIPHEVAKALGPHDTANLFPVTAPLDGVVVACDAVPGEVVEPSRVLFVIADPGRMWVTAHVRLEQADTVSLGQRVSFRPEGGGEAVSGTVFWIATEVDEKTRTVKVRAEVENPEGRLRAGAFGTASIVTRDSPEAVVVPDEAVHWEGCCHVVFVRLTGEVFQTRKVRLGARADGLNEVRVGLVAGEVIATKGSHVLKSELLKSRLGAGCAD